MNQPVIGAIAFMVLLGLIVIAIFWGNVDD